MSTTDVGQRYASEVRRMWIRRLFLVAGLVVFFLSINFPWLRDRHYLLSWAFCSAIVGLSMNVLVGYAGQISLAQGVIFGSGAFLLGALVTNGGVPWIIGVPVAGLLTAALALVVGFPALRVRGLNLAILTLGFQFVMQRSVLRSELLTRGTAGVEIEPPVIFGISLEGGETPLLLVIMATLVLIWMLDRNLTRSMAGRAFYAVRQDEQVASSFGIPVARYKLLAFAISGFYAGIAGALFGTLISDVTTESFEYLVSIEFLVFAVLGGLGSRAGTAVGGLFPVLFRQILDSLANSGQMLGGILLVGTLIRYPGGLAEQGKEIGHGGLLFWKRGKVWFLAFVGLAIASIAFAVLLPMLVAMLIDAVIGIFSDASFRFSPFWWLVFGILTLAVTFQVAARRLGKRAFGAAATGASPTEAIEAMHKAEAAHELSLAVRALDGAVSFRRPASTARTYRGALLEVSGVEMRFGGVRALDGVSLEVRSGELIGIMGPNGSGKTTLLNCVSGFLKPNAGDIRFRGHSVLGLPPHKRSALGIGRTFQNVGLVKQETVFDNFVIAQHLVCAYGPMEGLMRTGAVAQEERRLRQRAYSAIELLGLSDIAFERVRSLPHGKAKLVELGCALVTGPELLLLDEPAAGVSPQEADALGESLKNISAEFGVTILMIEHHVPLMLSTCDYIYVLNFGQLLTHGEPSEVARHPDVIAAYLGQVGKEASLATAGSR